MPTKNLLGEEITYSVRESEKASIPRIDVNIEGVRVVLPKDSNKSPEEFLEQKAIQVIKKLKKYRKYKKRLPTRKFRQEEKFPLLGKNRKLLIIDQAKESFFDENHIYLPRKKIEKNSLRGALKSFYKNQAKKEVKKILEKYNNLDFEYNEVKLKNQKTRWGSCSSQNNLNINWRIIMAPKKIIEYIVIHELIHLEENNHTKKFWSKVATILPDYKKRAKWLDENSPKLIFSEQDY